MSKKQRTVTLLTDGGCDMAEIRIGGKAIYVGNFWDYHPGCHGVPYGYRTTDDDEFHCILARVNPQWRGHRMLVDEIVRILSEDGFKVIRRSYAYTYK